MLYYMVFVFLLLLLKCLTLLQCFGKREKKDSFWDGENICGGQNGDGNVHGDVDDSKILVSQSCQVGLLTNILVSQIAFVHEYGVWTPYDMEPW